MGIVLVSDRNMQSLANYWRKHNSAISAVIYNDDGLDVANEKIRQLFIGRYLSFTRGNTLTQMEFTIMGYMVSGYNPYQIAEVLDMDIRSISIQSFGVANDVLHPLNLVGRRHIIHR